MRYLLYQNWPVVEFVIKYRSMATVVMLKSGRHVPIEFEPGTTGRTGR